MIILTMILLLIIITTIIIPIFQFHFVHSSLSPLLLHHSCYSSSSRYQNNYQHCHWYQRIILISSLSSSLPSCFGLDQDCTWKRLIYGQSSFYIYFFFAIFHSHFDILDIYILLFSFSFFFFTFFFYYISFLIFFLHLVLLFQCFFRFINLFVLFQLFFIHFCLLFSLTDSVWVNYVLVFIQIRSVKLLSSFNFSQLCLLIYSISVNYIN